MTPLKRIRLERGAKQTDLAEKIGIDQGYLSRIENGDVRPSPEVAARIADEIGREWITELHILYPERYGAAAA
jgi:transcriptional regulator with XRE-family HTH domain